MIDDEQENKSKQTEIKKIGEGAFGIVTKIKRNADDKIFACKAMEKNSENIPVSTIREIKVMRKFNHQNLVNIEDVINTKKDLKIVMEFCVNDFISVVNKSKEKRLDSGELKQWLHQILSGLAHMHSVQIMHRDLKPANILISQDKLAKIADFGSCRKVGEHPFENNRNLSGNVCTIQQRAPELLFRMPEQNEKVDIWSVGCIFAELVLGQILFAHDKGSELAQMQAIFALCGNANEEVWPGVSQLPHYLDFEKVFRPNWEAFFNADWETVSMLQYLLVLDPAKRPSAEDALQHDQFNEFDFEKEKIKIEM